MNYSIENDFLRLTVSTKGAEMMSVLKKDDNCEYLWQGDPKYWGDRALNLFPICGRLIEGKYTYKGNTYSMGSHGFVRKSEFEMTGKTENSLTFTLKANDETRACYPFEFEYNVIYTIEKNKVLCKYLVKNLGENVMYFALGGHPGFNVPLNGEGNFEDWFVEFENKCQPKELLLKECFTTDDTAPFELENGTTWHLRHDLFDNDAHFIFDMCPTCSIKSEKSKRKVTMHFPDMKYVGFWHEDKTDAPFLCIEPWTSVPAYFGKVDDFETKRDMFALKQNEQKTIGFDFTIE